MTNEARKKAIQKVLNKTAESLRKTDCTEEQMRLVLLQDSTIEKINEFYNKHLANNNLK